MLDLKAIFEPDESLTIDAAESCPAVAARKAVDMPTRVEAVVSEQFNEWPAAAADFVLMLAPDDLPPVPFALNGWTTITDAAKFLRSLRDDIAAGPAGPRAFYGAVQADLLELQRFALASHD